MRQARQTPCCGKPDSFPTMQRAHKLSRYTSPYSAAIFCVILLLSSSSVGAQILPAVRAGVFGDAGVNLHSSRFSSVPGFPAAPVPFDGGAGYGFGFGGMADVALGGALRFGLAAGYERRGAALSGDESTVFTVNGVAVGGTIRHTLTAALPALVIRPSLVYVSGRYEVGVGLTAATLLAPIFEARQEVVDPQGITLTARPFGGALPPSGGMLFAPSFSAGVRYRQGDFTVLPALRGEIGLNDIAGLSWRSSALRAGISVFFEPWPAPPPEPPALPPDTLYRRDTITAEVRGIAAPRVIPTGQTTILDTADDRPTVTISASYRREIPRPAPLLQAQAGVAFIRADGTASEQLRLEIRQRITKRFFPILPAVFFDAGSAEIPDRFVNPPKNHLLERYYRLLDTVAARLATSPQATLTLTAMFAGDSLDLMREMRADRVQNALRLRGNIVPRQMQLRTAPAPPAADPALREEAERVSFTASDDAILAPLIFYDTAVSADPPAVRFFPNIISDEGVESWRLQVLAGGTTVREFAGTNEPPDAIDWRLGDEQDLLKQRKPLTFRLLAVNYSGDTAVSTAGEIRFAADSVALPATGEQFDAIEYSIVFFDYNSSGISARDRAALGVLRRYCTGAAIEVTGMTDALGNAQYNRELSQRRADAVARILGIKRAKGVGSEGVEFPDNLPEGRMFNRRVKVSVER